MQQKDALMQVAAFLAIRTHGQPIDTVGTSSSSQPTVPRYYTRNHPPLHKVRSPGPERSPNPLQRARALLSIACVSVV